MGIGDKIGKLGASQNPNMTPSKKAIDLIKKWESLKLKAYLDPIGIPTIGWGTIRYDDGRKVKLGDVITVQWAENLLMIEVNQKAKEVDMLVSEEITQNQFDALVSFVYNLGVGALKKSTLLKKLNLNPNDTSIRNEFMKWVNAGGKKLQGLVNRRKEEADLYFS